MKKIFFYLLLLFTLTNVTGCKKDIAKTTGDLIVIAKDGTNKGVVDEWVYLYDELSILTYSEKALTDRNGQVTFNNLTPGKYYVDCEFLSTASRYVYLEGEATVKAGKTTTITIKP